MNAITCQQVEEQLDLLAAGECDRPTRRAVERHLESCAACAANYASSQQLQGMLALHWNEAAQLQRLHKRIDEAARQTQRPRLLVGPWMKRAAALAALLLVTFGLTLAMPDLQENSSSSDLAISAVALRSGFVPEMKVAPPFDPGHAMADVARAPLDDKGITLSLPAAKRGPQYRQVLRQLQRERRLPPSPTVSLGLELQNKGTRTMEVRFDDNTQLMLEIQGANVLRLETDGGAALPLFNQRPLRLAPGERRWLPIERLIAGSRRRIEYIYLTEPGVYTLTIRLRAVVDGKSSWLTSGSMSIHVVDE